MSVTGEEDGPPVRAGIPMLDEKGGIFATIGILTAFISRQKDGKGRQVDISMFDNAILSFAYNVVDYFMTGTVPGPMGSGSTARKRADYQAYQTKDGHMVIASGRGEDKWQALCKVLGREALASDPLFDTYKKRIGNDIRLKLEEIFKPILMTKTSDEWVKLLSAVDIPCAPVNRLDRVIQLAETQGRDMIVSFPIPSGEIVKGVANPVKVGVKENLSPPPRLGQYTREVLMELLNYSEEKISQLAEEKVVFVEG